ncbi:MAG: type II toxin-antitoxin system VapC family toxin [Candidatus Bathyarchaeia archaeon]
MKIALDTNVLIYFLEGIEPQASKVEKILNSFMKSEAEGVISTVTVAEVLTGFYKAVNQENAEKVKTLLNDLTLNSFKIVPVSFEIADLAAKLRAQRGGRLPDALIVVTALNQGADKIFSEDADFQRFSKDISVNRLV